MYEGLDKDGSPIVLQAEMRKEAANEDNKLKKKGTAKGGAAKGGSNKKSTAAKKK